MRFLVDVCAGYTVVEELRGKGHDVLFVGAIDSQLRDEPILTWAVREQRIVVTTDKDFEELVYHHNHLHWGILRLANVRISQRLPLLHAALSRYGTDLGPGVIVIAELKKIRIRRF